MVRKDLLRESPYCPYILKYTSNRASPELQSLLYSAEDGMTFEQVVSYHLNAVSSLLQGSKFFGIHLSSSRALETAGTLRFASHILSQGYALETLSVLLRPCRDRDYHELQTYSGTMYTTKDNIFFSESIPLTRVAQFVDIEV